MNLPRADVLIVGGGPAGSTCARALVRAGADVMVIDRATFPRDKPCGGWLVPQVFESLDLTPEEYGRDHTLQPIEGFRTGVLGGRLVATEFGRPVSYAVRRCELDHFLLTRSGAPVAQGVAADAFERRSGLWWINGTFSAPIIVGAGGHFCPVARHVVRRGSAVSVVLARRVEVELTAPQIAACPVDAARPELYFCRDLKGYGWIVRKRQFINVGLGREESRDLLDHANRFVLDLQRDGRLPAGMPYPWKGHAYHLAGTSARALTGDGVLMAGDAAGLAAPASGEGIRPAVESGLLAARAIAEAAGDADRATARYQSLMADRFPASQGLVEPPGALAAWLTGVLARAVLGSSRLTRELILERRFLHTAHAALRAGELPRMARHASPDAVAAS